ncbi:glutamate 5-kinase [Synechococcus sp. RSCCF101]|uniref:glutamate 5-kinase n=1 Tax=Synechococcus sp. RSCCF101 TaxID=2511069 RepID=UPI0012459B13|nr:glutamate 5-kinase [Synechococcus sp. RSCCF101]QEY31652.1 glutamate 5-kinase [Synechococcus sp. RSCCF101]
MTIRRVIKVGTSLLRGTTERPTAAVVAELAATIAAQQQRRQPVVLVTSGAVGLGCSRLFLKRRPSEARALQAAAAVGQSRLMRLYDDAFAAHGQPVAQVLLTRADLASRRRYLKASRTLEQLLDWGVVPIVNENDTVAIDELRFGDNDTLSALVAVAVGATELILLTDVDRLYTGDPRQQSDARPIDEVRTRAELDALWTAAGAPSRWGTGGMTTKLAAARIATASGVRVRLADGRDPAVLTALLHGEPSGTLFHPCPRPYGDRKSWLAHALHPEGVLAIDAGAERALRERGASLLAVGIRSVRGEFPRRSAVRLVGEAGEEVGRGISALSSLEIHQAMGRSSPQLGPLRDPLLSDAVVHRDELVITA